MAPSPLDGSTLVSVIIPAYNCADFIGYALESVLAQTHRFFEVLVVDDASKDRTREAALAFRDRFDGGFSLIQADRNRGRSASRNAGLAKARGEFIAFLDADDAWQPEKTERQLALFHAHPETGLVSCGGAYFDETFERLLPVPPAIPRARGAGTREAMLRRNAAGVTPGILLRRSLLRSNDLFDEELKTHEDYDLWLRLSERFPFDFLDQILVKVRRHGRNSHADFVLSRDGCAAFAAKHRALLAGRERNILAASLARSLMEFHALRFARRKDFKEWRRSLSAAFSIHRPTAMRLFIRCGLQALLAFQAAFRRPAAGAGGTRCPAA